MSKLLTKGTQVRIKPGGIQSQGLSDKIGTVLGEYYPDVPQADVWYLVSVAETTYRLTLDCLEVVDTVNTTCNSPNGIIPPEELDFLNYLNDALWIFFGGVMKEGVARGLSFKICNRLIAGQCVAYACSNAASYADAGNDMTERGQIQHAASTAIALHLKELFPALGKVTQHPTDNPETSREY